MSVCDVSSSFSAASSTKSFVMLFCIAIGNVDVIEMEFKTSQTFPLRRAAHGLVLANVQIIYMDLCKESKLKSDHCLPLPVQFEYGLIGVMPAVCLKTNFSVNLNRVESWKWPNGLCLRSTCPASAMIKCPPLLKAQTCIMQINLGPQSIMNHSCFSGEEGLRMASLEKRRAQAGQNVHCTIVCFSLTHSLNVAVFT